MILLDDKRFVRFFSNLVVAEDVFRLMGDILLFFDETSKLQFFNNSFSEMVAQPSITEPNILSKMLGFLRSQPNRREFDYETSVMLAILPPDL